jgi:hypothetical protein
MELMPLLESVLFYRLALLLPHRLVFSLPSDRNIAYSGTLAGAGFWRPLVSLPTSCPDGAEGLLSALHSHCDTVTVLVLAL